MTAEAELEVHRAQAAASEAAKAAAGAEQVKLLDAGMRLWLTEARAKFVRAGGYGCRLTRAECEEIRAAGYTPAPLDPWLVARGWTVDEIGAAVAPAGGWSDGTGTGTHTSGDGGVPGAGCPGGDRAGADRRRCGRTRSCPPSWK